MKDSYMYVFFWGGGDLVTPAPHTVEFVIPNIYYYVCTCT